MEVRDLLNEYEFDGSESAVWEAAAHKLFPYRIDLLTEYLRNTDSVIDKTTNKKYDLAWRTKHSTQIANLIRDHSLGKSATYLGNVSPELIEQGVIGRDNMAAIMLNQIVKGRFGDDEFVSQDKDTIEAIADLIENLDSNIHFNGPEGQFGDGSIGFGIDGLTRDKCIEGMFEYQDILHRALDPKGETFRKLKKAQIKKMRKLDQALSKHTHIPVVK